MSLSELTVGYILDNNVEVVLENGKIISAKWGGSNE